MNKLCGNLPIQEIYNNKSGIPVAYYREDKILQVQDKELRDILLAEVKKLKR